MTEQESSRAAAPRDERVVTFGGAQEGSAPARDAAPTDAVDAAPRPSQAASSASDGTTPRSKRRALQWGAVIGAAAIVAAVAVGVALANGGALQPAADDPSAPSASQQASEGSNAAELATTAASESAEPADEQPESEASATSEAATPAAPAEDGESGTAQGASTAGVAAQGGSTGMPSANAQSSAGGTGAAGGAGSPSAPSSPGASDGASAGSEGGTASNGQQQESPQTPPAEEPAMQTVVARIESSAADGSVSFDGTVDYVEGMTVFDVLKATGVPYNAKTTSFGVYVSAIGGMAEKDFGPQSGWKYSVNGEVVMTAANNCAVQPGDVVLWFYTTTG